MKAKLIDCTLREGCQALQTNFSVQQSVELARDLSRFGVDMIECGHPAVSPVEVSRVQAVVEATEVPVLAHARCNRVDIDAVVEARAPWIGLFIAINAISMKAKFPGKSRDDVLGLFRDAIRYAKSAGLNVRATLEDAGRTEWSDIRQVFDIAREENADRFCFADSVGNLLPDETEERLTQISRLVQPASSHDSTIGGIALEYHGHNDQGLALANALVAIKAGFDWISVSCNGIGERAGITDTFQLATLLHTRWKSRTFRLKQARHLSRKVEVYSRITRSPMQPFVGDNSFVHSSRLHQRAMKNDHQAYTLVDPAVVGGSTQLKKIREYDADALFIEPFEKSATELKYHRHGPGKRFVMIDNRLLDFSPYYIIARTVSDIDNSVEAHVDPHTHSCDSVFMFLGDGEDYQGLTVEVSVANETRQLTSPATVFIPGGSEHTYRFIQGSGTYINFVNSGNYNLSLMESS